jgi:hypothetical protein
MRNVTRGQLVTSALVAAVVASIIAGGVSAAAPGPGAPSSAAKSEHWGVITRNTIGSPVADLRDGPYVAGTGDAVKPPFGKGSLGIEVADSSLAPVDGQTAEKVDFGNEVDFFGDPVLAINQTGFHVFQTGENAGPPGGGPRNMPNIRFEINPNKTGCATTFTTMVWVPDPAPVVNRWSGYLDATTTGQWYFTGTAGVCTGCNQVTMCTFTVAKAQLNDGPPDPTIYTVAVGKGRDNRWVGAIDGFRINSKIYDFEDEPHGVHERGAVPHGPGS